MTLPPPLLVIVGPTAVGKTTLSLALAAQYQGEIVSADSRLHYQGMDIGTAKPTAEQRSTIPHHLIDICRPDQTLTLAQYQRLAYQTIDDIHQRRHLPLLVGGTGQYVKAIVEGWGIPEVAPQRPLRKSLSKLDGPELARWLAVLDPEAAEKIDPRNIRRVIRALEVTLVTGRPITELQRKQPPPYRIKTIGLHADRETLYQRIDQRVENMMAAGLLAEVESLIEAGYKPTLPAMSGLGYRQLLAFLAGERSLAEGTLAEGTLAEAIERIKFETHRFARQQYTWFRLDDPAISWFDTQKADWMSAVFREVGDFLNRDSTKL
jgi:tRNA dimethylallyltransferase